MQVTLDKPQNPTGILYRRIGWAVLLLLVVLVCAPEIAGLWPIWRSDAALSHGLLVPLIACGLLWVERKRLKGWNAADKPGLAALIVTLMLYMGAVWADIDFLKPLALIGMLMAAVWFLGGIEKLRQSAAAIGLLVFMIPWPTTLVDRLSFPLQLASSSYAALFAGMLGTPIHREGVHLFVTPNPEAPPIYSIVVAQQCSGLTSLAVLLLLGYLTAYFTPAKGYLRVLLVAAVVPLTLFSNSLRLTFILLAGAHGSPALAKWIHDHEGPVLIFFCSLGLMGLRHLLLAWQQSRAVVEDHAHDSLPSADIECAFVVDPPG